VAKPEPIPALKGKEAKELAERLKRPHAEPAAKRIFLGAMEEYRRTEERARAKSRSARST
jgi:hypothetical protein